MEHRNRSIPERDSELVHWCKEFTRQIDENPAGFGFTQQDVDAMVALSEELMQSYTIAVQPGTRTSVAIRAKNECRKRALESFRSYVRRVKANPDVPVEALKGLGLVQDGRERSSPTPPPERAPVLNIVGGGVLKHRIWFRDSAELERRGKPRGVTHIVVLRHVGEQPELDWRNAQYLGVFTRTPIKVSYLPKDAGLTATYFAAWITAAGEHSGWSPGTSMMIAGVSRCGDDDDGVDEGRGGAMLRVAA